MSSSPVLLVLSCLLATAGAQSCVEANWLQTAPTPARLALERMSPAERKNSSISVEFESPDGDAVLLGHEVESRWNRGQYGAALALLGNLEARVGHVAVGNSWRRPVPTIETGLWGCDIRIGNRDSLLDLAFDVDGLSGNFFVVLRHSRGPAYYSVCMSTDGGATWEETFTWVGCPVTCLDAGVLGDFYVAYYAPGENAQQVRVRRFQRSDGSAVEFRTGDMWVAACTLDMGDTARELSFVSSGSSLLFIATLVSDGSVLLATDDADAVSWVRWPTGIDSGASSGLGATYNLGGSGSTSIFLLSYLDVTDTMRIFGRSSSGFTQRLAAFCGTSEASSISASFDAVICAYEDATTSPERVRYAGSSDGGNTWSTGTLSDSGIAAASPSVSVTYWGMTGAVFRNRAPTCELRFRQRTGSGSWSDPVSIADNEPSGSRPSIKSVYNSSAFGVAYLSDTSPVVRGAFFVRGDWPYGVADRRSQSSSRAPRPTVVHGVLRLPHSLSYPPCLLISIDGRRVLDLQPGTKDLRALAPGVYFVHSAIDDRQPKVTKVVVMK